MEKDDFFFSLNQFSVGKRKSYQEYSEITLSCYYTSASSEEKVTSQWI